MITGSTKLLAITGAVAGSASLAQFSNLLQFIGSVVAVVYGISLLGLLWWKNLLRPWAEHKGWLDAYPFLKGRQAILDPKETEPAPLPTIPKR